MRPENLYLIWLLLVARIIPAFSTTASLKLIAFLKRTIDKTMEQLPNNKPPVLTMPLYVVQASNIVSHGYWNHAVSLEEVNYGAVL